MNGFTAYYTSTSGNCCTSYISGPNGEVYEVHFFSSSGPIGKGNWRLVQGAVSNE
jgi:hypothetical protein